MLRRLGVQPAAVRAVALVPAQLLEGQPAGALDEAALDLPDVDQRRQAVADVVHDVGPQQPVGAGEAVDLDLGHRRAVGEVLERLALHPLGVPVQPRGAVEAGRPQLHPLEVGVVHQLGPRDLLVVEADAGDHAVDEPDVVGVDAELAGRDHGEPLADLVAGVLDRAAVEVGARAGRGGRGVGHLVGAGRRQPDRRSAARPSAVAATWIILVCRPWPISVPPWLISTEPSL